MNPYRRQSLEPISEEITPTDHQVLCMGGTSSNLERLPSRLQRAKRISPNLSRQFEELAYDMSYLKAELQWHKEIKQILLQFEEKVLGIFNSLEEAITRANERMNDSEQQYLALWESGSVKGAGGYF